MRRMPEPAAGAVSSASSARGAPPWLPARVAADWSDLAARDAGPRCEPAVPEALPEPAARWLRRAVPLDAGYPSVVEFGLHGRIRIGRPRPFTAVQVLAPGAGYIWAVRTRLLGLPVTGFDRWTRGTGEMRHRILGRLPLVQASGPDLTRSAAGRLAAESVMWPPAALDPAIEWRQLGTDSVMMRVPVAGTAHEVTLTIGPDGRLLGVRVPRWARRGRGPYRERMFVVDVRHEEAFAGVLIPARIVAGYADEEPFIAQTVDRVTPGLRTEARSG